MSFKNEWKDLQDATAGVPNSGDDISVEPINKIAHQVILNEKNITNKVDKEDGKGLSTNDFTDEYKEKVDKSGEQVQSNWSQNEETAPDYIKNRTHYDAKLLIGEATSDAWEMYLSEAFDSTKQYALDVDGKEDVVEIMPNGDGTVSIMSKMLNQEVMYCFEGDTTLTVQFISPAHEYKLYRVEVVPLPEKYIPNSIARVSDVEEILDELHAYAQTLIGGDA